MAGWEAAAAKMAAKQAPAMFGKPEAQLLERFQSCLKTSFWDCEGTHGPQNPGRGAASPALGHEPAARAAAGAAGRLDEGVEECPL